MLPVQRETPRYLLCEAQLTVHAEQGAEVAAVTCAGVPGTVKEGDNATGVCMNSSQPVAGTVLCLK